MARASTPLVASVLAVAWIVAQGLGLPTLALAVPATTREAGSP